jgi:adenylate cyclase
MGREHVEVAVMFADVAGSTSIYDRLGDDAANRIIGKAVDIMKQLTEMHNGHVIKTIGDEVMSRFPSADDCVSAAKEIQEEMEGGIQGEDLQIAIRVGLHFGPAILMDDGDVFGDAVNVAARMAGIAKADQIITTEETVKLLSPAHQDSTRQFDKTTVKGKAEQIIVYQVIWQNEDLTRIEIPLSAEDLETKYLVMNFKGAETKIGSDDHRVFTLGRGVQSDLCVNARLASRMHATIQFVRGKFLLTDQSSNGTFVKTDEGESIYLRRQELMLWGSGHISLGEEISDENPDLIRFICP